ncbi:MAG TPA: hypothetical protein VMH01_06590 [Puia sp.]|nr:hypothetical protein [Puia sp.]
MGGNKFLSDQIITENKSYNLRSLETKQNKSLWLAGRPAINSQAQASRFLRSAGIALRYWPTKGIPLASMYQACTGNNKEKDEGQRSAIEFTNGLLASFQAIEVNVIAARICIVDKAIVPALYRLVRGERSYNQVPKLSFNARQAYDLILMKGEITAGDLRKKMGIKSGLQEDPAYLALAELQHNLLVDRGPFIMPDKGVPYLSKEGYPYHFFHEAHQELVTAAQKLTNKQAATIFLSAYLSSSVFCPVKKLISMFKSFLSATEIEDALKTLLKEKKIFLLELERNVQVCSI